MKVWQVADGLQGLWHGVVGRGQAVADVVEPLVRRRRGRQGGPLDRRAALGDRGFFPEDGVAPWCPPCAARHL